MCLLARLTASLLLLTIVRSATIAVALAPNQSTPASNRLAATLSPKDRNAESLLVVHYHRPDNAYDGWNLWCWPEGGDGTAFEFAGTSSFGRYAVVPFKETPARAGFLVRRGNWEEKDIDQDRFVELARGGVREVWIVSGDESVRSDPSDIDLQLRVVGAFLDAPDTITLATTGQLGDALRSSIEVTSADDPTTVRSVRAVTEAAPSGGKQMFEISLVQPVAPADVASLVLRFPSPPFNGVPTTTVFARDVLDGEDFSAPDVRLGAFCSSAATTFATWSPVSSAVDLLLYDDLRASEPARVIALEREPRGVWRTSVDGDLHGKGYRYRFANYGASRTVPDMHSFAATADSAMSVVVDLDRLEPPQWDDVPAPALAEPTDEIIYEMHVRDFSSRDETCPTAERGTYLGLTSGQGLPYLKELGVTAVHLLPVHDFTARPEEYNWGYWTTLFNVPESNYATDPSDPTDAIRDLRTAISSLHSQGFRVILDVVYNHTSDASLSSPFGATVPHYFFRTTRDGRLVNDTGVGNTIADERPMMRKYIVDSLEHWARQYAVDGFRFDLLGCHEPETVRAILARLESIRPDLTLYGEPWTGGGRVRFGKGAQKGLDIAVFNDHLRNAIRGDLDGTAVGVATGVGGDLDAIRRGVAGAIDDFARAPRESINYASAHDNLTLWDKIAKTQPNATESERRAMQKLALGIVLTSQGIAFLHGGCEFCRTKDGQHNTFSAGDDVNRFDWTRRRAYDDVADYVAGLVRLRRAHPAFTMSGEADVRRAIAFGPQGRPLWFTIDGEVAKDAWKRILVAYNDEPTSMTLELPGGEWAVVTDATTAGTDTLRIVTGTVVLPAYSMFVAHRE